MIRAVLVLLIALSSIARASSKPACTVDAQPSLSQEPLRYIRSKVIIEDGSGGRLVLMDEGGEWTSGIIQPGPRNTWVEWRNVVLGAGEYEVVLQTVRGCIARSRLEVF